MKLLNRVDYRRVETAEERDAVFRLRYQAYMREGAIEPNANETFSDALDASRTYRSSASISTAHWRARSRCTSPPRPVASYPRSTSFPTFWVLSSPPGP